MTKKFTPSELVQVLGMVSGVSPAKALRAIVRAVNGAESEFVDNPAAAYGREFKSRAVDDYCTFCSGKLGQESELYFEFGDLAARADCLTENGDPVFVHPAFSMRGGNMEKFKRVAQRPDWYAKIQLALFIMNKEQAIYHQWWPTDSCSEVVTIDLDYVENLLPRIDQFIEEFKDLDPKPHLEPLKVTIDTQEAQMLIDEYDQLKIAIDNASERQKEIVQALQDMANNEPAIICGRSLNKITRQGAIDYKKIADQFAKGVDVEQFRKGGSEFWQFR